MKVKVVLAQVGIFLLFMLAIGMVVPVSARQAVPRQPLNDSWSSKDIGSVGLKGSSGVSSDILTVRGSGLDIWAGSDQFRYTYQSSKQEGELSTRMLYQDGSEPWAKAGLMLRETLRGDSANVFIALTPRHGITFQVRKAGGKPTTHVLLEKIRAPFWLKLTWKSGEIVGWAGRDKSHWTKVGSAKLKIAAKGYIGFAVTAHTNKSISRASFAYVKLSNGSSASPTPTPSPTETASPSPTETASPSPSPTASPSPTPTESIVTIDDSATGTGLNQFNYVGGSWNHCTDCGPNMYNSSNSWDSNANDYVSFVFVGTQIKFYGIVDAHHGFGAFSIDEGSETNVDFYAPTRAENVLLYTSPVFPFGTHTLKIRATGTKNASSTDTYIVVDRVDVVSLDPAPLITGVDDTVTGTGLSQFNYVGAGWDSCPNGCGTTGKTEHWDYSPNEYVTFDFMGTGVQLYGVVDAYHGIAAVSIDGGSETNVDFYAPSRSEDALVYTSPELPFGKHTLKIRTTDVSTHGIVFGIDRVDVIAPAPVNLTLHKPTTSSSNESDTFAAQYATDGDNTTRWASSHNSAPEWLQIDLGASYIINEVKIKWEVAFAPSYTLQSSDDGTTWTTFYTNPANIGGLEDLTGLHGVGRYLRVSMAPQTVYGNVSIWEVEAYGEPD